MCMNGRCAGCGGTNQPCCAGGLCYEAGVSCLGGGGGGGTCGACGGVNQPACAGNACNAGLCRNVNGVCVAGGMPCGGGAGTCTDTGACSSGGQQCGGTNQPCCGNGFNGFCSVSGHTCVNVQGPNRCQACGGMGQPCCDPGNTCNTGTCGFMGGNQVCM
jgi:hypothetical protein